MEQCLNTSLQNACMTLQLYQDITGNLNSPQDAVNVSISAGFREAMIHFVGSTFSDEDA